MPKPIINREKCERARVCAPNCPMSVFDWDDETGPRIARPEDCVGCRSCESGCPAGAIEVLDEDD